MQIISKEKMERWDPEVPLMFIDYILEKKLASYGSSKDQSRIRKYLDDILEKVAIPKLTDALESEDEEERLSVSERLVEVSKNNADKVKPVLKFLEKTMKKEKSKDIKENLEKVIKNHEKLLKRKERAERRKKMRQLDQDLVAGKISAEEYGKARKEYLQDGDDSEEDET
ncbi:hypothetical protein GF325_13635 [Candidatus Bathyarchaeota archaeon]|nr:hypothetical protein [Candidatus Bathyarchaeota archaeon]